MFPACGSAQRVYVAMVACGLFLKQTPTVASSNSSDISRFRMWLSEGLLKSLVETYLAGATCSPSRGHLKNSKYDLRIPMISKWLAGFAIYRIDHVFAHCRLWVVWIFDVPARGFDPQFAARNTD